MDTNNRMKEIAANLRRDVKDLLNESASIVTNAFKEGLCTVRGATNRWRNFTHDISGAFVSLFTSPKEAILPDLSPEQEPIVTIMESEHEALPVGTQMTLSRAEDLVEELYMQCWDRDEPRRPVKVAIDYMLDGEIDRYWLPLEIGSGCGTMLDQMQNYVETMLNEGHSAMQVFEDAPSGLRELLQNQFGPQLHDDLEKLSTKIIYFFRQHYTISKLDEQFEKQALAMPEKDKGKFLEYTKAKITDLRKAANTSKAIIVPVQKRTAPARGDGQPHDDQPRQSVKAKLQKIKKDQAAKAPQHKRNRSQRQRE